MPEVMLSFNMGSALKLALVLLVASSAAASLKASKPSKEVLTLLSGAAIAAGAIAIGHKGYQSDILSTILLLTTPGTAKLMMAQVIGYGLMLGAGASMALRLRKPA